LAHFNIANGNRTTITVDTPAVLLDTVNTISIVTYIVDVHYTYAVVRINRYIVSVIRRAREYITVDAIDETLTGCSLFFEVYLAVGIAFRVDDQ